VEKHYSNPHCFKEKKLRSWIFYQLHIKKNNKNNFEKETQKDKKKKKERKKKTILEEKTKKNMWGKLKLNSQLAQY